MSRPPDTASEAAQTRALRFPQLDVLRGFAALSVVAVHVIYGFNWTSFPTRGPLAWFRTGWMGVDLFFVISGLVIGLSACNGLDRDPAEFRRIFIRHRLWRIVPLYYLTLALTVLLVQPGLLRAPDLLPDLAAHLLFVHNFWPDWSRAINAPSWTIGVEMQFYLLVLLAAPWLRHAPPRLILAAGLGIAWAWRGGVVLLGDPSSPAGAFRMEVAANQLPGVLDEFALGMLLARFSLSPAGAVFRARARRAALLPGIAAAASCWAMLEVFYQHPYHWDWPLLVIFFRSLTGIAAACLVLWAMHLGQPAALRLSRPLRYLGRISYGVYLWHMLVLQAVLRLMPIAPSDALLLVLGGTLLLAAWSWHFFEQPLLRRHGSAKLATRL